MRHPVLGLPIVLVRPSTNLLRRDPGSVTYSIILSRLTSKKGVPGLRVSPQEGKPADFHAYRPSWLLPF